MDPKLEQLLRLQQVDGRIGELLDAIAVLPKRMASLEQKLQAQKQAVDQAEKAVLAEEANRRRLESDLKDQQPRLAKYREQSSSVKTNEQFHALQHEIGFVEGEIQRIEEAVLASMMQSETLDGNRAKAKQEVTLHSKEIEREKESARVDAAAKRRDLDILQKEHDGLRAGADPGLLAQYDRLASSSRKTALARASQQRCLACQMALRPQFWNQIRAGVLLNCESCGRMLYFDSRLELPPESITGVA